MTDTNQQTATTDSQLNHDLPHETNLTRRRLLELGFWTSTGAVTLGMAGVGGQFLIGNSLEPQKAKWVELAKLTELPTGQVHRATYSVRRKDAWRTTEDTGLLYAFSDDGESYTVLSAVCTHLGCNVRWEEEYNAFACPCHEAKFARSGEVLHGPPPAPLHQLETKIENDALWAKV